MLVTILLVLLPYVNKYCNKIMSISCNTLAESEGSLLLLEWFL